MCTSGNYPKKDNEKWSCGKLTNFDCSGVGEYYDLGDKDCVTDTASFPECGEKEIVGLPGTGMDGYKCVDKPAEPEKSVYCPVWAPEKDGKCEAHKRMYGAIMCSPSMYPKKDDDVWTCGTVANGDCFAVGQYWDKSESACKTDTASFPECGEKEIVLLHR